MRKMFSMLVLAVLAFGFPAAAHADPFPAGACARVTFVDDRPICVIVDPTK